MIYTHLKKNNSVTQSNSMIPISIECPGYLSRVASAPFSYYYPFSSGFTLFFELPFVASVLLEQYRLAVARFRFCFWRRVLDTKCSGEFTLRCMLISVQRFAPRLVQFLLLERTRLGPFCIDFLQTVHFAQRYQKLHACEIILFYYLEDLLITLRTSLHLFDKIIYTILYNRFHAEYVIDFL